jgi:hypothetical protein
MHEHGIPQETKEASLHMYLSQEENLLRCRHDERPCLDGSVRGLIHGGHARAVKFSREALDVALQRHWPHARFEVEETLHSFVSPVQD